MKRIAKWVGAIILSLVLFVLIAVVYVNTKAGKKLIISQLSLYLNKKLGNTIQIGSLDFSIPKWVELRNVYIKDQANDTLLYASHLYVNMNMRSLLGSKWVMNEVFIHKAVINIKQSKKDTLYNFQFILDAFSPNKEKITQATTAPQINVSLLQLKDVRFNLNDFNQQVNSKVNTIIVKKLRYNENQLIAQSFGLKNSSVQYHQQLSASASIDTLVSVKKPIDFLVKVDTLQWQNNQFVYNLVGKPLKKGFDPYHLNVQQDSLLIYRFMFNHYKSSAEIVRLKLVDKTGFKLNQLSVQYQQKDAVFKFQQIRLKSSFSSFYGDISIHPNQYVVRLNNSILSRKDIQLLAPTELAKLKPALKEINTVSFNVSAIGNETFVNFKQLEAVANNRLFSIHSTGSIANIIQPELLWYELNIGKLAVAKQVLYAFLPPAQQASIQLPALLTASGFLSGSQQILLPNLVIASDYGRLGVQGVISEFTNPNKINYELVLKAKNFETGKWVRQDSSLGKLNGIVRVKGRGTNYKTLQLNSSMQIDAFNYNQVRYNKANIRLIARNGLYHYSSDINNEFIKATINGRATLNSKYPSINAQFNILQANLLGLGFLKDSMNLRTKGLLDLNNLDPNHLNISVKIDSVQIISGTKLIAVDSMQLIGLIDSAQNTVLLFRSAFMDAHIRGKYNYTELGKMIEAQLNHYHSSTFSTDAIQYNLTSAVVAKPHAVYAALLPGLFFSKNITMNLGLNSNQTDSSVWGKLQIPEITYQKSHLTALNASIKGINDSLHLVAIVDTIQASSVQLHHTNITGAYSKNGFRAIMNTVGQQETDLFSVGLNGKKINDYTSLHFQEHFVLKNEHWKVNPNNVLVMNKEGFYMKDLVFKNANQTISLNSQNALIQSPISVKITDFSLTNITQLMNKDSLLVGGLLNVDLVASNFNNTLPSFDGNASIDSLVFQEVPVGNVFLKVSTHSDIGVDFDGSLKGNGNHVTIIGKYNQQMIDALIKLGPIQMTSIEPFTQQNLRNARGSIMGDINISGNIQSPVWKGNILFDSVYAVAKNYGTVLRINQQKIDLAYPRVNFAAFTIKDSLNNSLVVDGNLSHTAGFDFVNNLTVKGKQFIAVDNSALTNSNIYGRGIVDVDAEVKGSITAPDIAGSIGLKNGSKITFVRQQTAASAKDRIGVIEFIDMDTVKPWSLPITTVDLPKKAFYASALNYNLNIDVDKEAEFILVIDPLTRDELSITGSAQLNAMLNPNGTISLIGAYNLSKGSYQLNYSFLKRKFALQEGSTIVFSGEPEMAEANITAVYEIEASPFDLIGTEISGNTNNDLFRQKMPFEVVLKVKGQVLAPQLEFDIRLKEKVAGINSQMLTTIDNKLLQLRSDASGMNKEVFALLVMGRFIGEQSADFFAGSSNGIKADQVVKESVSRFLSDAVSQIAADLIKGVDIDVNLRTIDDYSTATQRTDLGLALSKRFLDDRLTISVGKNFTVDGNDPIAKGQNNANVSFLPDVSTAYKLSKDGRYVLRAYRRNQYEAILDGYFIETGLAFSLSVEYNKFKELFKKARNEK